MATTSVEVIKKNLELTKPSFEQLNLNGLSFFKEIEYATQRLSDNSYLASANPESIRNALVNVAMSGLTLSPIMKMAYLVPRSVKVNGQKTLMCVLEPSYMGLSKVLTDTGSVTGISANIVYEKETGTETYTDKETGKTLVIEKFQIQVGIGGWVKHKPYVGYEHPGRPVACYSIARLPDGVQHVELLRPFEWEPIKNRSESVKSYNEKKKKGEYAPDPTWLTDEAEMIRKTCIKKHYKYLPKTERAEKIAAVIDLDNQANGIEFEKDEANIGVTTSDTIDTDYEEISVNDIPESVVNAVKDAETIDALKTVWADQKDLQSLPNFKQLVNKRKADLELAELQQKMGTDGK